MRTLVLNAGYEPLAIVSFKRALMLVMNQKANMVECDEESPVWGATEIFDRPAVIVLTRYVRVPRAQKVPVTRRGVLRRDGHRCAYCGRSANTIDHVFPRSRGGKNTWENLVAACVKCNNIKSDRTPDEMGWELRFRPTVPRGTAWEVRGSDQAEPAWEPYLKMAA